MGDTPLRGERGVPMEEVGEVKKKQGKENRFERRYGFKISNDKNKTRFYLFLPLTVSISQLCRVFKLSSHNPLNANYYFGNKI